MAREKSTGDLMEELKPARSPQAYLEKNKDELLEVSFVEYLNELLAAQGMTKAAALRMTNIHNNYGYEIFKGSKHPSRDKTIQLCLAMKLALTDAQRLLRLAGYSELYPRIKRDSIIIFALKESLSVVDTDLLLDDGGEECLQ